MPPRQPCSALVLVAFGLATLTAPAQQPQAVPPSVFDAPSIQQALADFQNEIIQRIRAKDLDGAAQRCRERLATLPFDATTWYNLACIQSLQGRSQDALNSLAQSVQHGFRDAAHIRADEDLASLRGNPGFARIVRDAGEASPAASAATNAPPPCVVTNGTALVGEGNTRWNPGMGLFMSFFEFPPRTDAAVRFKGSSDVTRQIAAWMAEGSAAGNCGDLYDNRDGGHSALRADDFPGLARVVYSDAAVKHEFHGGAQGPFLYNPPTIGNSSTALTSGIHWRSQARLAYTQPRLMVGLLSQYLGNMLYVYPEHRDYDPGRNGSDDGYGDVFPVNTPYLVVSQGSSGSDQVFLRALAGTLASFRPEVKQKLAKNGLLSPTLQMILRASLRDLPAKNGYLTGSAHRPVMDGKRVDALAMATMAHAMTPEALPPFAALRVVEETRFVAGRDYVDGTDGERLFDSPAAIARVARATAYERRLVVSAEGSRDVNHRPLTWQWVLLQGDPQRVTIRPLKPDGSVVEIRVAYHERFTVDADTKMESNRVDIGAFAHNGAAYSAPAFVTFFFPDNEKRIYDEQKRIRVMDYADPKHSANYADPMVVLAKAWRDEFRYDGAGNLLGWTRSRAKASEEFTADGAMVLEKDERGRPVRARTVTYEAFAEKRGAKAVLLQKPGGEILRYTYASPEDPLGRIATREKAAE